MMKDYESNWRLHLQSLTKQLETFQSLTNQLSKHSQHTDQWLQFLGHFSTALHNPDKRKKMVSTLAQMDQESKQSSQTQTGDFMYDLFNSPNMLQITKEVVRKKRKF